MKIFGKHFDTSKLSYINTNVRVRKGKSGEKGLFAKNTIGKGEIISVTAGIGLPEKAMRKLPKQIREYCYYVENGFFYCPLEIVSKDWFMNHSCSPNAGGGIP